MGIRSEVEMVGGKMIGMGRVGGEVEEIEHTLRLGASC